MTTSTVKLAYVALAALLSLGAAGSAEAAPPSGRRGGGVTAPTNVDEEWRTPYFAYMQFTPGTGCNTTTDCANYNTDGYAILFSGPVVPVGKRLVIKWVSAYVLNANGPQPITLQSAQAFENVAVKWAFYGPFYGFGMSSHAFVTYGPSERPQIRIGGSGGFAAVPGYVTISGYLIDAVN